MGILQDEDKLQFFPDAEKAMALEFLSPVQYYALFLGSWRIPILEMSNLIE